MRLTRAKVSLSPATSAWQLLSPAADRLDGLVFSDDLWLEGASVAGGIVVRGRAALDAGCDMVLVCNAREAAQRLLDGLGPVRLDASRAERIRGPRASAPADLPGYGAALGDIARERDAGGLA